MPLPKAEEVRAILQAGRDLGVSELKVSPSGAIEAKYGAVTSAELLKEINARAPLPAGGEDPIAAIRRQVAADAKAELPDMLEALANGARLVEPVAGADPTSPS